MKKLPKGKKSAANLQRAEMINARYEAYLAEKEREMKEKTLERIEDEQRTDGSFAMSDDKLPAEVRRQINRRINPKWNDVEPAWHAQDPRKRLSWPEFCRDFMGQNYGAIAQDLLEMHNSDSPSMKVQFLKFMMEMGKQGNPSSLQLDVNATVQAQSDIYSQLQMMTKASEPGIEDAHIIEPAQLEAPTATNNNQQQTQDTMAEWHNHRTEDDPFAPEEEQKNTYQAHTIDTEVVPSEEEIEENFPPICPKCGAKMGWESDFMLSECGYINDDENSPRDENGSIIGDRIVHVFACNECNCTMECEDMEDEGNMALLSLTEPSDDEEVESVTTYSVYAVNRYGMPDRAE